MGFGGSSQSQDSRSQSTSESLGMGISESDQRVFGAQVPFLQQLYQGASGVAEQQMGTRGATAQEAAQRFGVGNLFNNLETISDPQAQIDAQTSSLRAGLRDLFATERMSLGDTAQQAGAFGGSRHGIAEAALGGEIADAFTQGYGDIVANARNQAVNAAGIGSNVAQIGYQQQLDPYDQQFAPLSRLAGLLGGPTVLGSSRGVDYRTSESQATSRGTGDSSSLRLGFK